MSLGRVLNWFQLGCKKFSCSSTSVPNNLKNYALFSNKFNFMEVLYENSSYLRKIFK